MCECVLLPCDCWAGLQHPLWCLWRLKEPGRIDGETTWITWSVALSQLTHGRAPEEYTGVHVTAVLLWLKPTQEWSTKNPCEFLADMEWPCLQLETFEPWEFLCSVNNTEPSKSPHVTINLCTRICRAQAPLWFDMIKYLLQAWSLQRVSHGSLVICAHGWSPPLSHLWASLSPHLQNHASGDVYLWNTCEGLTSPCSQFSQVPNLGPHRLWETHNLCWVSQGGLAQSNLIANSSNCTGKICWGVACVSNKMFLTQRILLRFMSFIPSQQQCDGGLP